MRALVLCLTLLVPISLGVACDEIAGPSVPLDQTFTLAAGETAEITPLRLFITFVGVDGDSRCPGDALCITGGDARVLVDVISRGPARRYALHTGDMKPVVHEGLTLMMTDLQPYPFSSRPPIAPADYRVTLTASR